MCGTCVWWDVVEDACVMGGLMNGGVCDLWVCVGGVGVM